MRAALSAALLALAAPLIAEDMMMMGGAPDYATQVAPILAAHCTDCHGADDDQGRLRLHTPAAIRAGGRGGAVIVAGDPELSDLYYLCTLGADDPDRMPAEAPPLSAEELAVLRAWIAAGAPMPGSPDEAAATAAPRVPKLDQDPELAAAVADLAPVDAGARDLLELLGARIQILTADGKALAVDLGGLEGCATPEAIAALGDLAPHVIELDLARSDATLATLRQIEAMPRLRRLDLSRTALGDEALALAAERPDLRALNCYGTPVTARGLRRLEGHPSLRRLYCWDTTAGEAAIAALASALPACRIDAGAMPEPPPATE